MLNMHLKLCHVVVFFLFLNLTVAVTELIVVEIEHQCIQRCPLQNQTDERHYELDCGYECSINKCIEGCKLFKYALKSSCQTVCNGTVEPLLSPKELYCVMGCNDALARYFSQLRATLGTPLAPALVADSLTATSLKLEWKFPEARHSGLTYFVQWRYEEHAASWEYCRNDTWGPNDTVVVDKLQPYTKYRFRVALLLSKHSEPIVSAPSVVISTLPAGVPASPPIIVRAVPIDCTHISVSWEPGPFPHGPLLSYVLHITDNNGYSALKDIPAENNFYMYRDLPPSRNYTISVSMTNGEGNGPAAQVVVSTPAEQVREVQQPVLIFTSEHLVMQQGINMLDLPVTLYRSREKIRGVAIHVKKNLLFVSDALSNIHRISFTNFTNNSIITTILSPPDINFLPLKLSVDWLNNQLYILGEVSHQRQVWQITRCDLDGRGMQVAIAGLRFKPHHVEVDPYNGYLFWVVQGRSGGGLYRLDLSDISNGIQHDVRPKLIWAQPNLGAFTVDHTNYRLLCSNQEKNTIYSLSFNGKENVDVRPKIITRKMEKVASLAVADKTFYWTDEQEFYYEEYHASCKCYYHNAYPGLGDRPYLNVIVYLQSSQPTPAPINPPTSLQAIFGSQLVKITWKAPHLLGEQGKGAWQNWSYEVSIKQLNNNHVTVHKNINVTSSTITNLKENTDYIITAAAYTSLGGGPWSSEFRGKTLKLAKNGKYPLILWSSANGLLKSDATGENVQTVVQKNFLKDYVITDVAWYNEKIYVVTNNSQIFRHNLNTNKFAQILDIDSVGSIAIDWIGKKLYWSNPKQQLILRGNFNGTQQEPLPILTLAKELNIDAAQAYLYWSTGHAVECARLNGADRMVYHPAQLFSGKQVIGLTLDMDHNMVYWIIRSSEGSNLFRAPMAGYFPSGTKVVPESISNLQKPDMQGPLCYFNDRLLWLKDEENAVISDLRGKNVANINGKELAGLSMIYVMDSTLHTWPNITNKSTNNISVIPEPVDENTIKAVGYWNSFNITWEPCHKVNYGTVFYEIKVDNPLRNGSAKITTSPYIKYWLTVPPFTKLHVTIKAYTYWGTSPLVRTKIFSPPSTPSAPGNLRTYVSHNKYQSDDDRVLVTFRWDEPQNSNGVIQGYKIKCWFVINLVDIEVCENALGKSNEREYITNDLLKGIIYHFQVQAFTEVGDGELSQIISFNTSTEFPLPKLLVASNESIIIQDIDKNINHTLLRPINTPLEIGYIIQEKIIFWINDMQELLMFNLISLNRSKIADLNGNTYSLTVDWLERSLYYAQTKHDEKETTIFKLNLNHIEKGNVRNVEIFKTPSIIPKIEVSPFTRKLYWVEIDYNNEYHIMESNTDGTGIKPFFSSHFRDKRNVDSDIESSCSCPIDPIVEKTFTLDHSDSQNNPALIFIDSESQNIMSGDKYGCNCTVLVNGTVINDNIPLQTLKSDFENLYWTNLNRSLVFSLKKNKTDIVTNDLGVAQDILIFGSHMQPYPPYKCLMPNFEENLYPTLVQKTSSTLILEMPEIKIEDECQNISIPTTEYKLYYSIHTDDEDVGSCEENCTEIATFENVIEISKLQPYTKYSFFLVAENYFSTTMQKNITRGPEVIFQTSIGPPSKPSNISAVVLNPTIVKVSWMPPEQINGKYVWYEIQWQTEGDINGIRQKGEHTMMLENVASPEKYISEWIQKLSPNETYSILVRAYSQTDDLIKDNNNFRDSNTIKIKTFPDPENITLIKRTADELLLQMKQYDYAKITFQYTEMISSEFSDIRSDSVSIINDSMTIRVDELKPKTQYKFRLLLSYPDYVDHYVWPSDTRFNFETLGDRPSRPGMPKIQHLKRDVYQVWWEPSKENGAPIEIYFLEGLRLPNYRNKRNAERPPWYENAPSVEEPEYNWVPFYNGTDTFWIINGLQDQYRYAFRVSSLNSYGWSDTSEESEDFDVNLAAQIAEKQDPINLLIITGIPVLVCVFVIICLFCCKWYFTKDKKKKIAVIPRGPDVELATLRELPRRWIHNTNILYTTNQLSPDEITMLPHIRRDQITLMKFLGSGAFGEVYEGKARSINDEDAEVNVAIKTLRKGASDTEKCEFLQEAQLMSHFKHEHILQLLGVCLDNDPQFIIMELMQGGDLLTYLRSSRNPTTKIPSLTLTDLLKMCVDVAKGCRYLEEMHFVHRDLACRNCLVSSTIPGSRIVKIGDFGLTRDIYKNDYYRKEGEGLLPVRWMAPESLVDGVFTCQSDVWAFGVLLWEIMTLGQQPYPARNNLEVLHYVKSGGRLGKPTDCPEKLHELMLKCWYSEPERRPTFKFCLTILESLHVDAINDPVSGAHNGQYISTVPQFSDGVFNRAYFQDVFRSRPSAAMWKNNSDDESEREQTPFLTEGDQAIPTYLELIYDGSSPEENDGYEVPRSSIRSLKSDTSSKLPQQATTNSIPIDNKVNNQTQNTESVSGSGENHVYVNRKTELASDKKQ